LKRFLVGLSESRMAGKLAAAFVACAVLGIVLSTAVESPFAGLSRAQLLEDRLARESLHLLPFPASDVPVSVRLSRSDLARYGVYARDVARDSYLLVWRDGTVSLGGADLRMAQKGVHVHIGRSGTSVFIDGKRVPVDLTGSELFYLTSQLSPPAGAVRSYPEIDMADSFMRNDLFSDGNWEAHTGEWMLSKRGAGLIKIEARQWLSKAGIARTVNPFSVRGSGEGLLTYGDADNVGYRVEASFYFGVPQTSQVRDTGSLPGSFALVQGRRDGARVRFGWDGAAKRFVLAENTDGKWRTAGKWKNLRPPISSWCRLGLEVEDGYRVRAYLDGVRVLEHDCRRFICGPPHIAAGADLIEVDDVRAFSLGSPASEAPGGAPLYVQSTNFAVKDFTERDELQYAKWARGSAIFKASVEGDCKYITSTHPLRRTRGRARRWRLRLPVPGGERPGVGDAREAAGALFAQGPARLEELDHRGRALPRGEREVRERPRHLAPVGARQSARRVRGRVGAGRGRGRRLRPRVGRLRLPRAFP
jgi:hypothetical protein